MGNNCCCHKDTRPRPNAKSGGCVPDHFLTEEKMKPIELALIIKVQAVMRGKLQRMRMRK